MGINVNRINNYDNSSISFGRKPNAKEMQIYTSSVMEGLKLLDKLIYVIIHNSAAPSSFSENTGIGSLFSRTTQTKLIPFLKAHGITGIQQEPNNMRKIGDPSPYAPESAAKNILTIPLEKLTTEKYGNILPVGVFKKIVESVTDNGYVDYKKVNTDYDNALRIAYKNFLKGNLFKTEFEEFKHQNEVLEKSAIFRVLSTLNKGGWEKWKGIDKNLYAPKNEKQVRKANERISEIKTKYKDEIDFFMFQQFLIDMENKEANKIAKETGIKIIGDSPVANPAAEEWIHQDLFLKGQAIGCPPDYFSAKGQRWGFKYFHPKYIFNPDGTLGKAGKILKEKYDSFFSSFSGGLRIDHVIGLVDPFIYTVKDKIMTERNSGRIYSLFTGEFKKKESEYSDIMEKIVLQSAKEHGFDKKEIICEDLGDPNKHTQDVMKKLDLSGLAVTSFDYRGAETPTKNVIMIGSHDNESLIEFTDKLFTEPEKRKQYLRKTKYLAEDTIHSGASAKEIKAYRNKLRKDKKEFIAANFAELFTSPAKRIQIFFSDFWGIGKTYNRPGTNEGNWILRIGNDFENDYYKAVSDGRAPNFARAISTALRQRGLDKTNPELMQKLDSSAKILAEA